LNLSTNVPEKAPDKNSRLKDDTRARALNISVLETRLLLALPIKVSGYPLGMSEGIAHQSPRALPTAAVVDRGARIRSVNSLEHQLATREKTIIHFMRF